MKISASTLEILTSLTQQLDNVAVERLDVIQWAAPVISFGNMSQSKIATLGLNPSNREFVDLAGNELCGHERRFHTLKSLNLRGIRFP